MRRAHFPAHSGAALGFAGELWDPNPGHYQGAAELEARLHSLGRKATRREIAWQLAGHLLDDLLVAAGGVENSIMRFRNEVDQMRAFIAEHNLRAKPGIPTGVSGMMEAWYAFADLLVWLRTVEERIERRGNGGNDKQGLLPALKPMRLKKRVEQLFSRYRTAEAVQSVRKLSNFTLHSSLVRHPWSGARLRPDGTLHLPAPDPPADAVAHWYLFTWQQNRDGIELAEAMWEAVQLLIDGILDAFEQATPKRLRT
jgi:hypothetical protein